MTRMNNLAISHGNPNLHDFGYQFSSNIGTVIDHPFFFKIKLYFCPFFGNLENYALV